MNGLERLIRHALTPLRHRLASLVTRGHVCAVQSDTLQTVQVKTQSDELYDGIEHMEPYGFTAHPLPGPLTDACAVFLNGDRSHGVVLAISDRQYRPRDLKPGEACLFTHEDTASQGRFRVHLRNGRVLTLLGDVVAVDADSTVTVTAPHVVVNASHVTITATDKVRVDTPLFEVTGEIKDRCDAAGHTMAAMRAAYNVHVHPEKDRGGPTAPPTTQL